MEKQKSAQELAPIFYKFNEQLQTENEKELLKLKIENDRTNRERMKLKREITMQRFLRDFSSVWEIV